MVKNYFLKIRKNIKKSWKNIKKLGKDIKKLGKKGEKRGKKILKRKHLERKKWKKCLIICTHMINEKMNLHGKENSWANDEFENIFQGFHRNQKSILRFISTINIFFENGNQFTEINK